MKILVLGNADSRWTKEFIQYILLSQKIDVTVVLPKSQSKYLMFYLEHSVKVKTEYGPSALTKRLPFIRVFSAANQIFRNNEWEDYDYIINMFVNHRDLYLSRKIATKRTRIILYYCGSDVFRKTNFDLKVNSFLVRTPYCTCVGSQALYNALTQRTPGKASPQIVRFGISVFDEILKSDSFGKEPTDERKNVFCIGYNGGKEQQHLEVIKVFENLSEDKKKKLTLILPMTYRKNNIYIEEVKNLLDATGIKYELLTEFMNNYEMAAMWSKIGYFINAQTTDSLSASVLESVYAGCTLINGSWLHYPEYEEFNLEHYEFATFKDLSNILNSILEDTLDVVKQKDLSVIYDGMSWKRAETQWKRILV